MLNVGGNKKGAIGSHIFPLFMCDFCGFKSTHGRTRQEVIQLKSFYYYYNKCHYFYGCLVSSTTV